QAYLRPFFVIRSAPGPFTSSHDLTATPWQARKGLVYLEKRGWSYADIDGRVCTQGGGAHGGQGGGALLPCPRSRRGDADPPGVSGQDFTSSRQGGSPDLAAGFKRWF